ncbi:MAG: membrane protein insertion efficiency factor YidD [Candidatus Pelagibacter sp.]|jgi:putative membrane protein insertion efficiency factor|tara:strand:- start:792 stop:1022 length:231 start_codon:yes stop_codon:yes gene_type:complete
MIKKLIISIIKLYKLFISPYMGHNCRYLPTCSDYFIDSINHLGVAKGLIKGIKRLLSCHPIKFLGGGDGFDPVKKK